MLHGHAPPSEELKTALKTDAGRGLTVTRLSQNRFLYQICRRQCLQSKDPAVTDFSRNCPYWINYHGFTKHISIAQFPRLITEVIRGTDRHQKLKALRSASERTNASAKEDFCILTKPKVRGLRRAAVLSQIAVMVVLLKRIARFIIKVTLALRKQLLANKAPPHHPYFPGPTLPNFIRNLIQRE